MFAKWPQLGVWQEDLPLSI